MAVNRRVRWRWPWYVNGLNVALVAVVVVLLFWVRWMVLEPHWLALLPWSSGR